MARQWSWEFVSYASRAIFAIQVLIARIIERYPDVESDFGTAEAIQPEHSVAILVLVLVPVPEQAAVDVVGVIAVGIIADFAIADFGLAKTVSDWPQIDFDFD